MSQIKDKDFYEYFLDYNCLIPNRIIYFGSETQMTSEGEDGVNFKSASKLIKNLLFLDTLNNDRIYICWNSPGGDWSHGMAIYDTIKLIKSPVTMIGYCYVRSMGTIAMQACNERFLTPNAGFMIHDGMEALEGIPKTVESWAKESVYTRELMYKIYYDKIKEKNGNMYSLKTIEEWCSHDTIFRAEQAVALGLADKIITQFPFRTLSVKGETNEM